MSKRNSGTEYRSLHSGVRESHVIKAERLHHQHSYYAHSESAAVTDQFQQYWRQPPHWATSFPMWLQPSTKGPYEHYFQHVMDVFTCNADNSFTRILAYPQASTDDFLKKDLHTVPIKLSPKLDVLSNLVATLLILEGISLLRNPQALQTSNTDHVLPQNDNFMSKELS